MSRQIISASLLSALLGAAGVIIAVIYWPKAANLLSMVSGFAPPLSMAGVPADEGEPAILYWVAPMDPNYRREGPGKSPMGMDLIPVYEDQKAASGDPAVVEIAPEVVNNLGVRTAAAGRGDFARRIETVGYIGYDESRISHVHLRIDGWIERLLVESVGERIRKGQTLFELYSPTLVNAQGELLQAYATREDALIQASWSRLQALAMPDDQMRAVVEAGRVSNLVKVYAPQNGIVAELGVAEGMYVQPATQVMSLADLSTVWLLVDVFEQQAAWIQVGLPAEVRLPYDPWRVWQGQVAYVYPDVDPRTRTLKVRLEFDNPDEHLKPNMFAEVTILATPKIDTLTIPREGLIRTGGSERVILAVGDGRYRPVAVKAGFESGDRVEILDGLADGDQVVVSAQFLIDSESSLTGGFNRMRPLELAQADAGPAMASGEGVVNEVMAEHGKVNITHAPIPAINWPEMTMDFRVMPSVDLGAVNPGDNVRFDLHRADDGSYHIMSLQAGAAVDASGVGVVNEVMADQRKVNVTHAPIPALNWPEMIMDFPVGDGVDLSQLKPGDKIKFDLSKRARGDYAIIAVEPGN